MTADEITTETKPEETKKKNKDGNMEKWDFIFKVVTTISILFGIIWALVQFLDKKGNEVKEKNREYEFALFKERKETLYPLCNAAAEIVSSHTLKEAQEAIKRFEILSYGEVGIISSGKIAEAVNAFVFELLEFKDGPEGMPPPYPLIEKSTDLATECKQVLQLEKVFGIINNQ